MRPLQNKLKVKVKSYKVACALKSRGRHGAGPLVYKGLPDSYPTLYPTMWGGSRHAWRPKNESRNDTA